MKDTWDEQLSDDQFSRALTPTNGPVAVTFSDGNEQSYGAVLYLRWNSELGPVIRLVESKTKLTPLDQKGDDVKAEICREDLNGDLLNGLSEVHCDQGTSPEGLV